jgi:hypothetical protein
VLRRFTLFIAHGWNWLLTHVAELALQPIPAMCDKKREFAEHILARRALETLMQP